MSLNVGSQHRIKFKLLAASGDLDGFEQSLVRLLTLPRVKRLAADFPFEHRRNGVGEDIHNEDDFLQGLKPCVLRFQNRRGDAVQRRIEDVLHRDLLRPKALKLGIVEVDPNPKRFAIPLECCLRKLCETATFLGGFFEQRTHILGDWYCGSTPARQCPVRQQAQRNTDDGKERSKGGIE